jgi:Protein of unknown function (DUF3099)
VPRASRSEPVYRITGAPTPLSADVRARTRRYLWSMGVRTACFLGAIVAQGPLRWLLVAGALLLPYVSVVVANAGHERTTGAQVETAEPPERPGIAPAPGPTGS